MSAKAVFITHSLLDVTPVCFNRKTLLINLYHGIPIKKVEFLDKNIPLRGRIIDYIKSKRTDVFVSNSKYYSQIYQKCFRLPLDKIKVLGYPRMEFLLYPERFGIKLKDPFNNNKGKKFSCMLRLIEIMKKGLY